MKILIVEDNLNDFDGLDKLGVFLAKVANLPKEKLDFLSTSGSSRKLAIREGYRAYRKNEINKLIQDYLK